MARQSSFIRGWGRGTPSSFLIMLWVKKKYFRSYPCFRIVKSDEFVPCKPLIIYTFNYAFTMLNNTLVRRIFPEMYILSSTTSVITHLMINFRTLRSLLFTLSWYFFAAVCEAGRFVCARCQFTRTVLVFSL